MSKMRKFAGLILAMIMVFAMAITASAADPTITAPSNGHTYEVYQIFTGVISDNELTSVKWGKNGTGTEGTVVDAATLKTLTDATDATKMDAIKAVVNINKDNKFTTVASGATVTVPAGYYLVKDVDGSISNTDNNVDAYTLYIVEVVGNVTISPKTGTPTVQKKVDDKNDSNTTEDATVWQDSADYDIGDEIPYQLTATMGDLSNYKTYWVEFQDTMTHLTYVDGSVEVTVGGEDKTSAFTPVWDAATKTLKVTCPDVIAQGATTGTKIVVTYKATLDSDAVIGSTGNPNAVRLEFSNNPNNSGDGTNKPGDTDKTPEDVNIVFTYKVVANKVTEDSQALVGASFKLEKKLADGTKKDLGTIDGTQLSTFEWKGIDAGDYVITETKTPTGYNAIDPIEFTVTATHSIEADAPVLESLTGGNLFTGDVPTGAVTGDIVNKTGATLPTTGGMGTTLIYVLGAALALGAGVLLIAKKRVAR